MMGSTALTPATAQMLRTWADSGDGFERSTVRALFAALDAAETRATEAERECDALTVEAAASRQVGGLTAAEWRARAERAEAAVEQARRDGYADGVLGEREHTARALDRVTEAQRERDEFRACWHRDAAKGKAAIERVEAERDELRARTGRPLCATCAALVEKRD